MDFATLKKNILPFWSKAKTYSEKAGEKAKVYGEKALDFTQRQVQSTPIFLKNEEAYNIHVSSKRAIFIAYDENEKIAQEVLLRAPVWAAKAWTDNAEIRYLSITQSTELARNLGVIGPIEMRVSYEGYEYMRTNDIGTMKQWWENRRYQKDDTGNSSENMKVKKGKTPAVTEKQEDPLAEK